MTIFLVTIVLIAIIATLAYPFVVTSDKRTLLDDAGEELAQRLRRARDRVYEEIRALQQEHFLGNLTDEEYEEQLTAARLQAADLMRQQQQVQQTLADAEAAAEQELQATLPDKGTEQT